MVYCLSLTPCLQFVSPILILVDCFDCRSHATYNTKREEKVISLIREMERLNAKSNYVKQRVQLAEQKDMARTSEVANWLKAVDQTHDIVKNIIEENAQLTTNGLTCLSAYMVGKKATEALEDVSDLSRYGFAEVAIEQPRPSPTRETEGWCEIPMGNQNLLGNKSNIEKVLKGLNDENVGIIGLYGIGGTGKTMLLSKINNELPQSGDDAFECALWVVASRNATIRTIQQTVMEKLKIPFQTLCNKSVDDIRNEIYKTLKNKKYLLMLDDVWKRLDLFEGVGIPKPDNRNKSKIIFTTRMQGVCFQMKAHLTTEVECLPREESWSLFQENVGKATLSLQIKSYAIKVAEECNGLPLALITIGRAMSGKVERREWLHALDQLQNSPSEILDLEEEVFRKLRLSYDYLGDSTMKKCFLYCSLFPEDHIIESGDLIDLWMGEGYLNKKHDIKRARNYGCSIIEDLKRACLLESGSESIIFDYESVKMHDVIRDMALWIAKKEFVFVDKAELMRARSNDQDWNGDVEKMSLWGLESVKLPRREQEELLVTRECPNLSTLLFRNSPSVTLSGLFNFIPNVRVLDLSGSHISYLPEVISKLEDLEYLDISKTSIGILPKEMKGLRKLKYLLMDEMRYLKEFPAEIIDCLTELLVFSMYNSLAITEELLRSLEKLKNIQQISMDLESDEISKILQKSEKLQLCTRNIIIMNMVVEKLELCTANLTNLERLCVRDSKIKGIKVRNPNQFKVFTCLRVAWCNDLKELDMLVYAPSLTTLTVWDCRSIERIIQVEEAESVFLSLKFIALRWLPSLKNISNKKLSFPSLVRIEISDCPELEQNPFNEDMMSTNNNLRQIKADKGWWNSLTWRYDVVKHHFSQFYKEY